jgi:hypothetical protein
MQGLLRSSWPKMGIHHCPMDWDFDLYQTDRIEAQVSLETPSGILTATVYIDPTYVRSVPGNLRQRLVDACMAISTDPKAILHMISRLPEELCELDFDFHDGLFMLAKAIDAPTTITLLDGRVGSGVLSFPDDITDWTSPGVWTARALETGKLVNGVRQPDVITFPD